VRSRSAVVGTSWKGDKLCGADGAAKNPETKYGPGECCGTKTRQISGHPDKAHISTSFAGRQNLMMRMRMRRFARLTNGLSKKLASHEHSVALHFMVYDFIRPHQVLTEYNDCRRTTPAMAAGITSHVWTMEDLLAMTERLQENKNTN
jgi:hypothetical protein